MNNFKIYKASFFSIAESLAFPLVRKRNPIFKSMIEYHTNIRRAWEFPYFFLESIVGISPMNIPLINYVLKTAEKIGDHLEHNLDIDKYIQLTRFYRDNEVDRINCDWCSIVNGFNEFYIDAMKNNSATNILKTRNIFTAAVYGGGNALSFIPISCFNGYEKATDSEAVKFIRENNISYKPLERIPLILFIKKILSFRNIVARVEERWCPFGYVQDLAYERNYWGTEIEAQCNEIRKYGRVKCDFCVTTMNAVTPADKGIRPSVYTEYMAKVRKSVKHG